MNSTEKLSKQIRIVLVETSHPGNIGSTARAMKTMGLSKLYLISPKVPPNEQTKAMASGADDIIDQAQIVPSLSEAVGDCQLVVGVSARIRGISLPLYNPEDGAKLWLKCAKEQQHIALLFGREDRGLTNDELKLCHQQVHIASNPYFSSLNLAAAVQVITYEIKKQALLAAEQPDEHNSNIANSKLKKGYPKAQADVMEHFFKHLEETLRTISFFKGSNPEKIMLKLRRLYNRAEPDELEVSILRGILAEVQRVKNDSA